MALPSVRGPIVVPALHLRIEDRAHEAVGDDGFAELRTPLGYDTLLHITTPDPLPSAIEAAAHSGKSFTAAAFIGTPRDVVRTGVRIDSLRFEGFSGEEWVLLRWRNVHAEGGAWDLTLRSPRPLTASGPESIPHHVLDEGQYRTMKPWAVLALDSIRAELLQRKAL